MPERDVLVPLQDNVARRRVRWVSAALLLGVAAMGLVSATTSAPASWFSRIIKEAGDAADGGLDAGRTAAARGAPRHVAKLADAVQRISRRDTGAAVVGASATGGGGWTFVNASGEVFTAANADELARVRSVLLPDADPRRATQILLSDAALFTDLTDLSRAFPDAEKSVAFGRRSSFALRQLPRAATPAAPPYALRLRGNVDLELTTRANMAAALEVLERPLRREKLTVLALRQRTPAPQPRQLPRKDTGGIAGLEVAETDVAAALRALRGRTVVLTGRVGGDTLTYRTAQGFDREIALAPLRAAAIRADVTLLLVNAPTPRQPGVRNWLWQRASLAGSDKALEARDLAGLVSALADGNGRMIAKVDASHTGRTTILITPETSGLQLPGSGLIGDITATVLSETTGNVIAQAIELDATSAARQSELDWRWIPWLPSWLQWGYVACVIAGLAGLPYLRAWWVRVWPPEASREYGSRAGLVLARGFRALTFLLVFLPLAGVPAAILFVGYTLWRYFTWPFRVLFWLAAKLRRQPT